MIGLATWAVASAVFGIWMLLAAGVGIVVGRMLRGSTGDADA